MTPETIAASLGAAIVTGLVFGVYPAVRASRLVPVDAIRASSGGAQMPRNHGQKKTPRGGRTPSG